MHEMNNVNLVWMFKNFLPSFLHEDLQHNDTQFIFFTEAHTHTHTHIYIYIYIYQQSQYSSANLMKDLFRRQSCDFYTGVAD